MREEKKEVLRPPPFFPSRSQTGADALARERSTSLFVAPSLSHSLTRSHLLLVDLLLLQRVVLDRRGHFWGRERET